MTGFEWFIVAGMLFICIKLEQIHQCLVERWFKDPKKTEAERRADYTVP